MNHKALASRSIGMIVVGTPIAAIFVADLATDWAIAVAVLYVIPVLLSLRRFAPHRVRWLAAGCVVLTLIGSPFTRFGSAEAGAINLAISITAIVTTTYLGLRMLGHEAASHEARAQLQRLSRIGNLGELTAAIAHEVNQPLAALTSSAGAGRRWLDADPPDIARARESLERIARDAARAAESIAGVRRLSSQRTPARELVDLPVLIGESTTIARAEIERRQITLHLAFANDLPLLRVDPVQIQQVMLNLLLNAIESLAEAKIDNRLLTIRLYRLEGSGVIVVADNGPGLSREARMHLWEPFWTGKEGGTGLGLTISRAIVEAHGGTLSCGDVVGSGAVFELRLPIGAET